MRERVRLAITILLAAAVTAAVITADPPTQDRALAIGSLIRCPVCQGESIADSPSDYARDMMSLVEERVEQGFSDQQIIDELLASFTGSQLLDPEVSVKTLALWLTPAAVLVAGTWIAVRQRQARAQDPGSDDDSPARTRVSGVQGE